MNTKELVVKLLIFTAIFTAVAFLVGFYGPWQDPGQMFREGRPATLLSAALIFLCAWICWKIYRIRHGDQKFSIKTSTAVWAVFSLGFIYIGLDELFHLHESIDHRIHDILGKEETRWSDRIDDLILGLYGVGALGVIYYYRDELLKYKDAAVYLVLAFVVFFVMVVLDALTNGEDLFNHFFPDQSKVIFQIICAFEEYLKYAGSVLFFGAFYQVYTSLGGKPFVLKEWKSFFRS